MVIKLVVGQCTLNVVSAYAPHAGLDEEVKRCFWEGLDEIIHHVPPVEKLVIGGDFNVHIGSTTGRYDEVHGGFSFGERNGGGTLLLYFAKAFGLVIANSSFPKREKHLVNFQNAVAKTQIDYLLRRRRGRGLCKDCKVIPGEILVMRHRLLVMDVGIMVKRRKMSAQGRPRIRYTGEQQPSRQGQACSRDMEAAQKLGRGLTPLNRFVRSQIGHRSSMLFSKRLFIVLIRGFL
uniref:Craniofacial development protein 2-like n=1 Tax=Nicotiana sylvestris TaxID=4096 RepID=A0A1U7VWD6_NICSY|nr:PREDICTED: craniofacial development protein 2-like [Nicotiana sylvestris]